MSLEKALELGGLNVEQEAFARQKLQRAKELVQTAESRLAAQQAETAADAAAARAEQEQAEQARRVLRHVLRLRGVVVGQAPAGKEITRMTGCKICREHFGLDSLEWPRYCGSECRGAHWAEHRKVCASKQQQGGGGAAAPSE